MNAVDPQAAAIDPRVDTPGDIDDDWAPTPGPISGLHCPSCNGPSVDGNRCQTCREFAPAESIDQIMPARVDASTLAPVESVKTSWISNASPDARDIAAFAKNRTASARATVSEIVAKAEQAARKPTVVERRPVAPVVPVASNPKENHQPITFTVAAVALAVIGVAAYWYNVHEKLVLAREEQMAIVVAPLPAPEVVEPLKRSPTPVERPITQTPAPKAVTVAPNNSHAAAAPKSAQDSSPRPISAVAPKLPARTSSNQKKPVAPPAPAKPSHFVWPPPSMNKPESSGESILAPSTVPAKPIADPVDTPTPVAAPVIVGQVFDTNEVNEPPRIQSRARPKLPAELKNRPIKEVVVVRALVSQSGLPTRISLLRRSKTGPQLDDVVLESVNRWTFSPAKKKGAAVSCWFNFAVEVDGAE